jgi:hypothetical protein
MCYADRSGAQTFVIVAYATVAPGDVASRITVTCTFSGIVYGFRDDVAATSAGVAVIAEGAAVLVAADQFRICYRADADYVGGGTVTLTERCYMGSPFASGS